jgi:protein TonB
MLARAPTSYPRDTLILVGILLLHLLAIRAIWLGLTTPGVRDLQTMLQIAVLPAEKPERPPPLPPVSLNENRAIQVPSPEVDIPAEEDSPPSIQAMSLQQDTSPLPTPAAAPTQPAVPSVPSVRPRPIYVPGGWERYPAESIRAHETGRPTITICISAAGTVDSVELAKSSGFPRLDQAAVNLGREARFRPALRDGKPMAFCLPYRVTFAIRNS